MTRLKIGSVATSDPRRFVRVSLFYTKGEGRMTRGYFISTTLVEIDGDFELAVLGQGFRQGVEEAARFSQKRLDALLAEHPIGCPLVTAMVAETARQGGVQVLAAV